MKWWFYWFVDMVFAHIWFAYALWIWLILSIRFYSIFHGMTLRILWPWMNQFNNKKVKTHNDLTINLGKWTVKKFIFHIRFERQLSKPKIYLFFSEESHDFGILIHNVLTQRSTNVDILIGIFQTKGVILHMRESSIHLKFEAKFQHKRWVKTLWVTTQTKR